MEGGGCVIWGGGVVNHSVSGNKPFPVKSSWRLHELRVGLVTIEMGRRIGPLTGDLSSLASLALQKKRPGGRAAILQ